MIVACCVIRIHQQKEKYRAEIDGSSTQLRGKISYLR